MVISDTKIWLSGVDMKRVILKGFFQMVDERRGVTKTLCKIKKDYFWAMNYEKLESRNENMNVERNMVGPL